MRFVETNGKQDTIPITVTAPGLLTVETTGSTDTVGMLDLNPMVIPLVVMKWKSPMPSPGAAAAISNLSCRWLLRGISRNFRCGGGGAGPSARHGAYTLDMEFKVAMGQDGIAAATGGGNDCDRRLLLPTWTAIVLADAR